MKEENHADFISKEMAKKYNKEHDERVKAHPKYESLKTALGKRGAADAILHELNNKQK